MPPPTPTAGSQPSHLGHRFDELLSSQDPDRELVKKTNVQLREFVDSPKNEAAVDHLLQQGFTAAGLLWSLSAQARAIPVMRSIDPELVYQALEIITRYPFYRAELLIDPLKQGQTKAAETLSLIEIAADSSSKLCSLLAGNISIDLIRLLADSESHPDAEGSLSAAHSRRLFDVLMKLINHEQGEVNLKLFQAFNNNSDPLLLERQWLFGSKPLRELVTSSLNTSAEATLKGRKNKNIIVEQTLRVAHLLLAIGYPIVRSIDDLDSLQDVFDGMWRLAKAKDPLTTLAVIELFDEAIGNRIFRRFLFTNSNSFKNLYECILASDPFQDLVRGQCFRMMSKYINSLNQKTNAIPDVKAKDCPAEWKYYIDYLNHCVDPGLPDGEERDQLACLLFECWGVACAGGRGFAIGLFEEYVPMASRMGTKLLTMKGVNIRVILALLYSWKLVIKESHLETEEVPLIQRDPRGVKTEGDAYHEYVVHYFLNPLIALILDKPFEDLRTSAITLMTALLRFESAMPKMLANERLVTLLRIPQPQPICVERYEFINTLFRLYDDREISNHITPSTALRHFKQMIDSRSYAYIAPEMRQGEVQVQTV